MKQWTGQLEISTSGPGMQDITHRLQAFVTDSEMTTGLLTVLIQHTSASLTIQENADPDVQIDLVNTLHRMVPANQSGYRHTCEGPDDMPAHVKCSLTGVQISIPVQERRLALGTWQGVYVMEHRLRPHRRRVVLHLLGE